MFGNKTVFSCAGLPKAHSACASLLLLLQAAMKRQLFPQDALAGGGWLPSGTPVVVICLCSSLHHSCNCGDARWMVFVLLFNISLSFLIDFQQM